MTGLQIASTIADMDALRRRSTAAVQALEQLQRHDRESTGLPELSEDRRGMVREIVQRAQVAGRLEDLDPSNFVWGNRAYEEAMGQIASPDLNAEIERATDQAMEAYRLDEADQWSVYEHPAAAMQIADACRRIEEALDLYERSARGEVGSAESVVAAELSRGFGSWNLTTPPVVGTLNTGQVDAHAQMLVSGHPAIILQTGLFPLFNMLAAASLIGSSELRQFGRFSDATMQFVSDVASSHAVLGTCIGVYPRTVPASLRGMAAALELTGIDFVLSHEYAHIVSDDFAQPRPKTLHPVEYAADEKGLRITISAVRMKQFAGAAFAAPSLYFAGLELIRNATASYNGISPPSGTAYPTPRQRHDRIIRHLRRSPFREAIADSINTAEEVFRVVTAAWNALQPVMEAARDALREFEPSGSESAHEMEIRHYGVVATMWQYVQGGRSSGPVW